MKHLTNLRLFSLLLECTENNMRMTELRDAYEEFAVTLLDTMQTETDFHSLYYNLGFVRLELSAINESLPLEGRQAIKHIIVKAIALIREEQKIISWQIQNGSNPGNEMAKISYLRWTARKSDLVELIYSLSAAKCINNGKAKLTELTGILAQIFNIELGSNISRIYFDLRIRKNRTAFLDKLRDDLDDMMEVSDS